MPGAVNEEQVFAWQIGIASLTVNYTVLHWNGATWDTEASGTLTEIGSDGLYEVKFTPDAAGFWLALANYTLSEVRYDFGMAYFISYGVEQDNYVILSSGVFGPEALKALIDAIIADIGVFPTANYASLATYVEDIRNRLITILADVTGIAGAAMRGTDNAALAASWTAALATILGNFTALRIGYLDELDFDLQAAITALNTLLVNGFGAEYDGSPNSYDVQVTGYTDPATSTPVGAILERLQLLQETLIGANTKFLSIAATVNTVTCAALVDGADLYEKMMLVPLDGNQAGQGRYITTYNGTNLLTVVPDWSSDPDAGGAFNFVIEPTPAGFLYEAGKGLSANYDLVNGILVMTRIYSDFDIQVLTVEEPVFEYDDAAYVWHPEWLVYHLDEAQAGEQFEVKVYEKDNDTDDNWRLMYHGDVTGVQAVPVKYVHLPPVDLAFKVTVEQTGGVLRDVLFKLYKKS